MWRRVLDQLPNFEAAESVFHPDMDDGERVQLMLSIFYDDMNFDISNRSSDALSARTRVRGDEYYKQKSHKTALKFYNEALRQATGESQSLALAFSNRSALLFLMCKYEYCFRDVSRAMEISSDDSLNSRLRSRGFASDEAMRNSIPPLENKNFDPITFKIDYPNPRIACADWRVDLAHSNEFGRYVVATEDIQAGAILSVEEPYVTAPSVEGFKDRCHGCLRQCMCLLPCAGCSSAQYCSESCRTSDNIHRYECDFLDFINNGEYSPVVLLAIRSIIRARLEVNSWEELADNVYEMNAENDSLRRCFVEVERQYNPMNDMPGPSSAPSREQFQDVEEMYDHRRYASVYTMYRQNLPEIDWRQKSYAAAQLLHVIRRYMPFFPNSDLEDDEPIDDEIVAKLLHHHLSIIESNHFAYPLRECDYMGVYPFTNMYNHSCMPNARVLKNGTNTVVYALAPIKKGKQIFISYGPEYAVHDYAHRVAWLDHYKIKCYCKACVNQWQTFKQMPCDYLLTPEGQEYFKNVMSKEDAHLINIGNNKVLTEVLMRMFKHVSTLDLSQSNFEYFKYETIITMFMILAAKTSKNDNYE